MVKIQANEELNDKMEKDPLSPHAGQRSLLGRGDT
jgi:hypothetical protein